MIEQARFTYSLLEKKLENQIKTIEDKGKKQAEVLKYLKPSEQKLTFKDAIPVDQLNEEATTEIEKMKLFTLQTS